MTAQLSTYSSSLIKDPQRRTMLFFNRDSKSQQIIQYERYFDHQKNVHWVAIQVFKIIKQYDFYYFWKNDIILVKNNYLSWFRVENGDKATTWQLATANVQSKILAMQIHAGLVWILYVDTLLCYTKKGTFIRKYKNSIGLSWTSFVVRANFIILYEQTQFCLMIINRKNENEPMVYSESVPKQCTQLRLVNNLLFMKADDSKSIVVFKLIKK